MNKVTSDSIKDKVVKIVQKVKKNNHNYVLNAHLTSQGADSLDMFDILISIQDTFSINIDIDQIEEDEWSTIEKMANNIINILGNSDT